MKRSSDFYRLFFLFSTALRKFAYRQSFTQMIRQSPFFSGASPDKTASNVLSYLTKQDFLRYKALKSNITLYHLTGKGLSHLSSVLAQPQGQYPSNLQLVEWMVGVGLNNRQLPSKPFNPRARDFLKPHEMICDDISTAWLSAVGRPIVLISPAEHRIEGILSFCWCLTERQIRLSEPINAQRSIDPDIMLIVNGRVGEREFTRVGAIEVEITTDWLKKVELYRHWAISGGFSQFYEAQQSIYPIHAHTNPPLTLGLVFETLKAEERAQAQLTSMDSCSQPNGDTRTPLRVKTSHAGKNFGGDAFLDVGAQERTMLFW